MESARSPLGKFAREAGLTPSRRTPCGRTLAYSVSMAKVKEEASAAIAGILSPARLAANRENAKKSTGPRTEEGKAIASKNATRHGLLSKDAVLLDESPEAFERLRADLRSQLDPVGEIESLLAERIALCAWRLARAGRIEVSLLRFQLAELDVERARAEAKGQCTDKFESLIPDFTVVDKAKHAAALERAREAGARRDAAELGAVFLRDARQTDGLAKLSRYEAALERNLYRALHELQRLQASRLAGAVSVPAVVDVDVSSLE
jgi:hypothetical protein